MAKYPQKKYVSKEEALVRAMRYCDYQERCHLEVRQKLKELGVYGEAVDDIIVHLIEHGFLNEERFARAFSGSKFRVKKWGRIKIRRELELRDISPYCIRKGMEEIEEDIYRETLKGLLEKELERNRHLDPYQQKHKSSVYVMNKGFEPELVWEILGRN